ncbi:transposase protein domain-containing protein [Phthorimaea operculella]|nr:transposase protein domain-containing protein [Phthorimaea operculella]
MLFWIYYLLHGIILDTDEDTLYDLLGKTLGLRQNCFNDWTRQNFWMLTELLQRLDSRLKYWTLLLLIWIFVTMSIKKCSVPNCEKSRAENTILHVFPNPDCDLQRFLTWKNAIGGEITSMDHNAIFKLRRVCHDHFEEKYYTRSKRLSFNAVPTLHLSGFSIGIRNPSQNITARVTNQNVEMHQLEQEVTPKPSSSSQKQIDAPLPPKEPIIGQQDPPASKGNKIKQLQKSKDNALAKLKKALKLSENKTFQKTLQKFTAAAIIFTMLQFREIGKNKLGRRFTKEEKIMALAMYKQGPRAYRWMRKFFVLPSPLTLSKMITTAAIKPGMNTNIFKQLKKKASKMSAHEKLCILMFDEVALTPHFDYSKRRDTVVGFVDNGRQTKKEIADHALVFMMRGILKNYKQPVAYSFCSKTTPREELVTQIKMIIKQLHSIGFKVIATVCDQGATNMGKKKLQSGTILFNYIVKTQPTRALDYCQN